MPTARRSIRPHASSYGYRGASSISCTSSAPRPRPRSRAICPATCAFTSTRRREITTGLRGVKVGIHLRGGKTVREIVQLATDVQADPIVVGSHKGPHVKDCRSSGVDRRPPAQQCRFPRAGGGPKAEGSRETRACHRARVPAVRRRAGRERWQAVVVRTSRARGRDGPYLFLPELSCLFSAHDSAVSPTGVNFLIWLAHSREIRHEGALTALTPRPRGSDTGVSWLTRATMGFRAHDESERCEPRGPSWSGSCTRQSLAAWNDSRATACGQPPHGRAGRCPREKVLLDSAPARALTRNPMSCGVAIETQELLEAATPARSHRRGQLGGVLVSTLSFGYGRRTTLEKRARAARQAEAFRHPLLLGAAPQATRHTVRNCGCGLGEESDEREPRSDPCARSAERWLGEDVIETSCRARVSTPIGRA